MEKERLSLRFGETIPATLQAVEGVVQNIMALASEMRCGEGHFAEIELALREALANAVIHGNRQDPAKNGNGAKPAESSKTAEPVEESDNPFNDPSGETMDQEIPF